MNRRKFLGRAAALPIFPLAYSQMLEAKAGAVETAAPALFRRVRPGDPLWPSKAEWDTLGHEVEGRLIKLESPLAAFRDNPDSPACRDFFRQIRNPYYIADQPVVSQTSGWVGAWTSSPSVYAVAAAKTSDVVAAVNFARKHNLRLVVRGGGHSYQGTSNSADSLLVWTKALNSIVLHDSFVARGCEGKQSPQPAVTVGSGAIWMHTYDAVTTKGGRYVQGGGCATVGVAGLVQSGGFGSFSKNYGTAAAGLLEAEVVTADGAVRIVNSVSEPDLFWGLKGGGGGCLGIVTRLTLRTRELPVNFGGVSGRIRARSDAAFRDLTARVIDFYHQNLFNPHWGEQIVFESGNTLRISMVFQGLTQTEAEAAWKPFLDWLAQAPQHYSTEHPVGILALPARHFWDATYMKANHPDFIVHDPRPGAPENNVFWRGDGGESGQVLHAYRSAWLPASLLNPERQHLLAEALFAANRRWEVSLHFNKGLAGASDADIAAARDTATNPAVLDAFALAIIAGGGPPAFPGIRGHEPNLAAAQRHALKINASMTALLAAAPDAGSYVSESDYFERRWQQSHWGSNYARLAEIKKKYDPTGLFFVHHGVGSEDWSQDGFTRLGRGV